MNKISKINFIGFALTATALFASSAMMSGCGQPPSARATMAGSPSSSWPQLPPGANLPVGAPGSTQATMTLESFNAAQINAILGNYGGTFRSQDQDGNPVDQPYTVTLSRVGAPSQPGKTAMQASFTGGNIRLQGLMQITAQVNGASTAYTLYTPSQVNASIDPNHPVSLLLQLVVSSSNQVDPASEFPIYIGSGGSSQSVVDFYNDWGRR